MRYLSKSPAWLHPTSLSENTCELKSSVALTRVHRRTEALHPENICKVALLKLFLHSLSIHVCVALLVSQLLITVIVDLVYSSRCPVDSFIDFWCFSVNVRCPSIIKTTTTSNFTHFVHIFHFFCDPQTSINQFQAPKKCGHLSKGMFA